MSDLNWTQLSHEKVLWPAIMITADNTQVPQKAGNFLIVSQEQFHSQRLCYESSTPVLFLHRSCDKDSASKRQAVQVHQDHWYSFSPSPDFGRYGHAPDLRAKFCFNTAHLIIPFLYTILFGWYLAGIRTGCECFLHSKHRNSTHKCLSLPSDTQNKRRSTKVNVF